MSIVKDVLDFLFGRKKARADTKKAEFDAIDKAVEIYNTLVTGLSEQVERLTAQVVLLRKENVTMHEEVILLRAENKTLHSEIEILRNEINRVKDK